MADPLLVSVLTICGSGISSAWITHRLNATAADKRIRLEKLELLYKNADDFCSLLVTCHISFLGAMKGDYDYNEALNMQIERMPKEPSAARDAEMLMALYFPEMRIYWERVMKAREGINAVLLLYKRNYKETGPSEEHAVYIPPLRAAFEVLEKAEAEFKEQAYYIAESLSGKRMFEGF